MEKSASPFHAPSTGKRASSVIEQIFAAEHPDHFTRSVPAQRLYLAVKEQGLPSAAEVIEMASREQIQVMLDLDLWTSDRFEEEQVWEWLELPDTTDDLSILQKVLHSLDPKLIAMLMSKYLEVVVEEEPTEKPPGDGFYTPDKGHTWIRVNLEDSQQEFLFKRLLALIFETSAELFYQLIQIPSVATLSALEEESFQEKSKRLSAEGFPDTEWAAELQSALPTKKALSMIHEEAGKEVVQDIHIMPAFVQSYSVPEPLRSLLSSLSSSEDAQQELTLLCNSGFVHFRIPTWEQEQIFSFVEQVRGTINIGLQTLMSEEESLTPLKLYEALGMKGLYRVGLSNLFQIRTIANRINDDQCGDDPKLLTLLAGLRFSLPKLPNFLSEDGSFQELGGKLEPGFRAMESDADIALAELLLKQLEKK